jgi:hypothetical protein
MALVGVGQQRRGFGVDGDSRAARGAIDPGRDAVVAVARVLCLDAVHVGDGGLGRAGCARVVIGPEQELVLRRHRSKQRAEETHRSGRPRRFQNDREMPASIHRAEKGSRPGLPLPPSRQPARCR